jgi:hypothetical protein
MVMVRPASLIVLVLALGACGSTINWNLFAIEQIEGNSSGGIIPKRLATGDVQAKADAFCKPYDRVARITFNQGDAGGKVVFICEDPAPRGAPSPSIAAPQGPSVITR